MYLHFFLSIYHCCLLSIALSVLGCLIPQVIAQGLTDCPATPLCSIALPNCQKALVDSSGAFICAYCKDSYFPPPLPSQFQQDPSIQTCTEKLVWPTTPFVQTIYVTNKPNFCRNNLKANTAASCQKHSQLGVCQCSNYADACGNSMDGSKSSPFDSLFEAMLSIEKQSKNSFQITIDFIMIDEANTNIHEVLINEYSQAKLCIATSFLADERFPLHFFAHKNASISFSSDQNGSTQTLNLKKLAFHVSTLNQISVKNIIIEGKDAVQEQLKSPCTYARGLECCLQSASSNSISTTQFDLNTQAIQLIDDADRLVLRSLKINICQPLFFFLNSQQYPPAGSVLLDYTVEASSDFRLDNNQFLYRHFGLFNVEFDPVLRSSSIPQPSIIFTGVVIQNVHVLGGVYHKNIQTNKIQNYGYNTVRSIIHITTTAKVDISDSSFQKSYLSDGFLSNIVDYSPQLSSLYGSIPQDCQNFIPCSAYTISNSKFQEFNNFFWRMSDSDQLLFSSSASSRGINSYTLQLSFLSGELNIFSSLFTKAVPILSTSFLFCPLLSTVEDYVQHDSTKKLHHPAASFQAFEYSKIMNSHIVLIQFTAKLNIQNSQFYNNTSLGGPAISLKDLAYTSTFEMVMKKKEIVLQNNDFQMNFGILSGSVIRIVRRAFDLGENYCGPIFMDTNNFSQNVGCRSNFGGINIQCLFGSAIESGIQKTKDIELVQFATRDYLKQFAMNSIKLPTDYNTDYLTVAPLDLKPYEIRVQNNTFSENLSPWCSGLYIFGGLLANISNNSFINNGVLHNHLYFLIRNTFYHEFFSTIAGDTYYNSIDQGFIADDGMKFMKETSALFLDICDQIIVSNNKFTSNWGILTGDSYIGSSLNIYRSVSFHGLNIHENIFSDHKGIPENILRQNVGSWLVSLSAGLSVLSINILSHSDYSNAFGITVSISNNQFSDNTYYITDEYIQLNLQKNIKFQSYIQSYKDISLVSLIKFYYEFDVSGDGPRSSDVQSSVSDGLEVIISGNNFTGNIQGNSLCMVHLIAGETIRFNKNIYLNNRNNLVDDTLSGAQSSGLYGQICTTDRLGILGQTGKYNQIYISDMEFTGNQGKLLTHITKVSQLRITNVGFLNNFNGESFIDIISHMDVLNPTIIENSRFNGNHGQSNGVLSIMESEYVNITTSQFQNNTGIQINAVSVLDSNYVYIADSLFSLNSYSKKKSDNSGDEDQLIKPSQFNFATTLLLNASSVIAQNTNFTKNQGSHGGGVMLSSFSYLLFLSGECSDNSALTGGCFFIAKSSNLVSDCAVLSGNNAQLAGGAIGIFDSSQYTDDCSEDTNINNTQRLSSIITLNSAENGAGIYSQTSYIHLKGTQINQNSAIITSSAISLYISYLTASQTTFENNFSQGSATIYMIESEASFHSSTFFNNQAASQTYGIKSDRSLIDIESCSFQQNSLDLSEIYFINGGFINLSEGKTIISSSTFTGGGGQQGGAIYSGFESELSIRNSLFTSNTAIDGGGSLTTWQSSDVRLEDCTFINSSSQHSEGTDIQIFSTKYTLILQTVFNITQGTSIYGLNAIIIEIANSTFTSSSSWQDNFLDSFYEKTEIDNDIRGIHCELCQDLHVFGNSVFTNLSAAKGAGILVDNQYRTFPMDIHIEDTIFSTNKAYQGGGIYLGGNIMGWLQNVTFDNNMAFQPQDNAYFQKISGIGGGLVYDCPRINPDCSILFQNGIFKNNIATKQGGGFQWKDKSFNSTSTFQFSNNTALYGKDIASYAVCVIKVTSLEDNYPDSVCFNKEVGKGREIITRFNVINVASGQNVDNANYYAANNFTGGNIENKTTSQLDFISFALVDHLNNRVKSDSYSKLTVMPTAKLTQDNTGWEKIFVLNNEEFAVQGFFSFSKMTTITVPGSIIELSVITDGIPFRLDRQMMSRRRNRLLDNQDGNDHILGSQNIKSRHLSTNSLIIPDRSQITQSSDATVQVELRKCVRGEILTKEYTCQVCPEFEFSLVDSENLILGGSCEKCDQTLSVCLGGYLIAPKPGYWRLDSYKKKFYKCPKAGACLGSLDLSNFNVLEDFTGYCREGHTGNLCDSCIDNWAMFQNQTCVSCQNNLWYWVRVGLSILVAFVQIVLAIKGTLTQNTQPMKKNAILMKMIINFVQTIFIFTSFGIQLPDLVSSTMSSTNEVLAAPLQIFNFDCIYKARIFVDNNIRPYFAQTIVLSLIPVAFSIIAIIYWSAVQYSEYGREAFIDTYYKRDTSNKITVSVIIVLFTLLPKIIDLTLRAYKCVNIADDDDPQFVLKADYDVQCWSSQHWYFIVLVAVPSLLIWGILCPMQLFHFFNEKKEKLFEKEYLEAYGFLLRGYTKKSISNEFIIFYRKILLIFIAIYVDFSSLTQVLIAFGVIVLSLAYHNSKQPYSDVVFNNLETKSLLCQSIVLIALLYISAAQNIGVQSIFLLVLLGSYGTFTGHAGFYYMKETILGVFQGFYNNIDLYNLLKKASDKLKVKFIGKLERMFKEKFLPLEYDHKREMNVMFTYLQENMDLTEPSFAKDDEFIGIKRTSKLKLALKKKVQEINEKKKLAKKLKKIDKQREKQSQEDQMSRKSEKSSKKTENIFDKNDHLSVGESDLKSIDIQSQTHKKEEHKENQL